METLILLGLIIGLAGGIAVTNLFYRKRTEKQLHSQSVLLLEKIKQVCKLITVEGEFSEIFTHRDEKILFFKLFQAEKKALLIVKAKVMIGFDLTRINIEINSHNKQVILSNFPDPEILSIDSDLEYYDIQKGLINKFSESDLNNMHKKSKEFIREKVENSHLILIARQQAHDTVSVIRELIESVGWKLSTENIALKESPQQESLDS
ncbi:DUF4230 domain-containing protein [Maribellus sp. CM-23]|uniref:DUF4230 domain-containing protein n=1 Tax=Maribellus sp. CM-23 TaxID=2781026 RepID=UPI001F3E02B7|nr:DUF4230 domain-containing protein [Maribellus sp. CM-23]MCE4564965.1 DUF4230 domain-containing protein [Maribellus sp. CM-23]